MGLEDILGEELFNEVQDKLDDDTKLIVNDGSYLPRDELNKQTNKLESKIKQFEKQLEQKESAIEERDRQLEQLKEDTQATEELQQKVEQFQSKNEDLENQMQSQQEEFQQQLKQEKLDKQIKLTVEKHDPRDDVARKAIISNLDREEIELTDDGEVKGINDQLESMKESAKYLFGGEEKVVGSDEEKNKKTVGNKDYDEMTDQEYFEHRKKEMGNE